MYVYLMLHTWTFLLAATSCRDKLLTIGWHIECLKSCTVDWVYKNSNSFNKHSTKNAIKKVMDVAPAECDQVHDHIFWLLIYGFESIIIGSLEHLISLLKFKVKRIWFCSASICFKCRKHQNSLVRISGCLLYVRFYRNVLFVLFFLVLNGIS